MGYRSRPGGPSFPRALAVFGVLAGLALALVGALSGPPPAEDSAEATKLRLRAEKVQLRAGAETGSVEATIRRDSHGIPHILADDFKGLGSATARAS